MELYEQAGRMLGVGEHADGGFVGSRYAGVSDGDLEDSGWTSDTTPDNTKGEKAGGVAVQVSVQMSPEFQISASGEQSEEAIVQVIRRHLGELADELGGEIASRLEAVFSNMPRKGA